MLSAGLTNPAHMPMNTLDICGLGHCIGHKNRRRPRAAAVGVGPHHRKARPSAGRMQRRCGIAPNSSGAPGRHLRENQKCQPGRMLPANRASAAGRRPVRDGNPIGCSRVASDRRSAKRENRPELLGWPGVCGNKRRGTGETKSAHRNDCEGAVASVGTSREPVSGNELPNSRKPFPPKKFSPKRRTP
jgi:hypothetical protein